MKLEIIPGPREQGQRAVCNQPSSPPARGDRSLDQLPIRRLTQSHYYELLIFYTRCYILCTMYYLDFLEFQCYLVTSSLEIVMFRPGLKSSAALLCLQDHPRAIQWHVSDECKYIESSGSAVDSYTLYRDRYFLARAS